MSNPTTTASSVSPLGSELACYLQGAAVEITLIDLQAIIDKYDARYTAWHYDYQLPLGRLQLLELVLSLPADTSSTDVEKARMAVIKATRAWHDTAWSQEHNDEIAHHEVFVFDIQCFDRSKSSRKSENHGQFSAGNSGIKRFDQWRVSRLDAHCFSENGSVKVHGSESPYSEPSYSEPPLQVFGWHEWQKIVAALGTPCELWRFLSHHLDQQRLFITHQAAGVESIEVLIEQFLHSPALFSTAIAVDNALIKDKVQDAPNPALVAMSLAAKNHNATAQMHHQHMLQAAGLWSQLSTQMIAAVDGKQIDNEQIKQETPAIEAACWQQQLLDESLFARHELVRTLYRHPKQAPHLQREGYVVHQHSYESMGRHYVLIFYGHDTQGQHSKQAIQPNLAKVAHDVACRLPIADLHHIVVLGIDFITDAEDTFIDIDLWIQPVDTMTQRERQLTKQVQGLKQQLSSNQHKSRDTQTATTDKRAQNDHQTTTLAQIKINLSVPARKN